MGGADYAVLTFLIAWMLPDIVVMSMFPKQASSVYAVQVRVKTFLLSDVGLST